MNLHEYQAKYLFSQFGLPVPKGHLIRSVQDINTAITEVGGQRWVAKAQVHAGGRGKAGGVRLVSNKQELLDFVQTWLGQSLVTYQTGPQGQPVSSILLETPSDIERELYLSLLLDRTSKRLVLMASNEGGVDIEKVAEEHPEKIFKIAIDPVMGLQPFHARRLAHQLNLHLPAQIQGLRRIMQGLLNAYLQADFSLVEVNPLVVTRQGELMCLDGKINIDENALYRQSDVMKMRDTSQEDPRETHAKEKELNYIALDGNIGCMVNGAGLAMATMDLIKLHGGAPANFLDVGGTATQERVIEAFKIILSDSQVKSILVNIFGGIVRGDLIAEGIIGAVKEVGIKVPIVVRLEGNQAERATELLQKSGLNILSINNLSEATLKVVQFAQS